MRSISIANFHIFFSSAIFALVQVYALKNAAYILMVSSAFLLISLAIAKNLKVNKNIFFVFWVFLLFCVYQVRLSVSLVGFRFLDFVYFAPILLVLLCSSLRFHVEPVSLYRKIIFISITFCLSAFVFHSLQYFPKKIIQEPYAGTRWMGGFDGPNEFGQFYSLALALLLGLSLQRSVKTSTLIVGASVFLIAIWFSFSRGTILSLGVLFFAYMYIKIKGKNKGAVVIMIGASLVSLAWFFEGMLASFYEVRSNSTGRDTIIKSAVDKFYESPIIGNGFGAFDESLYMDTTTPHSDYLYFLVSGGLFGIVTILALYGYLIFKSYKLRMFPEFLFFLTFAAHSVTFNNLVRGRLSIFFWIVLLTFLLSISVKDKLEDRKSACLPDH